MLTNPNLFIVSGGPGTGKTTLIAELAKLGFSHAPEVARQIIQEQVETGGNAVPWGDREAYTGLMLQRSIESFRKHTPAVQPLFCDRGIPDTLCYARLIGLADTAQVESACREYRYAPVVFMAPPWEAIYRTDRERKQDFAEAVRTYEFMLDVYREYGYQAVELPQTSPAARAQFVVDRLPSQA